MKIVGNDWENSLNGPNSSKSLPNCPKMSQNVPKCPKMPTSDASLSERTCSTIKNTRFTASPIFEVLGAPYCRYLTFNSKIVEICFV